MAKLGRKYRVGKRFDDAIGYALRLHRKQQRKGKNVPYAAHLLGTAGTVLDFGGDEDQAIAALLHDAAEDHGGRNRLEKIRERFGPDVATMVEDCTDTFEEKKPEWKARKQAYIASLPKKAARSLRVDGPDTLERFQGKRQTVWYFRKIANTFQKLKTGPIAAELEAAVREMERLTRRS